MLFKKGKLVFTDELQQDSLPNGVAYFTAKAIVITTDHSHARGDIETLKVSDLILKQAKFVTDGVNTIEAHKLYSWPAQLGDNNAWAASKTAFIEEHILNFPIEIISVDEEHHPTWTFITPEEFKKFPEGLDTSPAFQEYLDRQETYFFLRKERNDPK